MKDTKKKKPHAGHGYLRTIIDHHGDLSHTVRHEHEDGKSHKSYAVADLDAVHDGLEDHLGEANGGEDEDIDGKKYANEEATEEKLHPGLHAQIEKVSEMGRPEEGES
jgi:hypothetical protein